MARTNPVRPAWRQDDAREGSYRSVFCYDPSRFKHPSDGWVAMFKDEFAMTDADFAAPAEPGRRAGHPRRPTRPRSAPSRGHGRDRRRGQRRRRRPQPGPLRPRQDRRRGPGAASRPRRSGPRPGRPPAAQGGRRRDRRLLLRPQDPDRPVRRRVRHRPRHPRRRRRHRAGAEDAHEPGALGQRAQHDGGGPARPDRLRLRGGAARRTAGVRHHACLHLRPLPPVLRDRVGGRLDQRARVGAGLDVLRRRLRPRGQPGVRHPGRRHQEPWTSRRPRPGRRSTTSSRAARALSAYSSRRR